MPHPSYGPTGPNQRTQDGPAAIRQERQGWRDEALCGGKGRYDPDLWYTPTAEARRVAKAVCAACPVFADCYLYAMRTPVRVGIVAGMTHSQLTKVRALKRKAEEAA